MIAYERATAPAFLAVAALDREAWQGNRNPEFIPDGEHAWRLWVEHALVIVAREHSEVIGAILAFPCLSGAWCVHKVFVRKDKRGCGIGTKLFSVLLREIDRIGADCFLTVDPLNKRALKLYESWGFGAPKFVKGYYRAEEDRIVLTRESASHGTEDEPSDLPMETPQREKGAAQVCRD